MLDQREAHRSQPDTYAYSSRSNKEFHRSGPLWPLASHWSPFWRISPSKGPLAIPSAEELPTATGS